MLKTTLRCTLAVCVAMFAFDVRGDEVEIPVEKLPKKIVDVVKKEFPGAKLVKAAKEDEKSFEVGITHKGAKIEVTLDGEGKILEVEREITAKDLPKPVTKTLGEKYPKATFKKVETIREGETQSYEVLLVTAKKETWEVKLSPTGKVIEEEKKTGDEED